MLPIAAAWKVTYQRLPADADIKTATELTSIRAAWRTAASTIAWTLERAYNKIGKPVPAWIAEKKNATAPDWLPPDFNGTVPDGMPSMTLPKDQAIQQTIAGNGGLFAPKQAAEIAATEVYINAVTNDAPPEGAYRQVSRDDGWWWWWKGGGRVVVERGAKGGGGWCLAGRKTCSTLSPSSPPLSPPPPPPVHQSRGCAPQPALQRGPGQRHLLHHPGGGRRHQHRHRRFQRARRVRGPDR